jgi:hypothetical protein
VPRIIVDVDDIATVLLVVPIVAVVSHAFTRGCDVPCRFASVLSLSLTMFDQPSLSVTVASKSTNSDGDCDSDSDYKGIDCSPSGFKYELDYMGELDKFNEKCFVLYSCLNNSSTVQYSTVQYSTVQCSAVQCSAVQFH